MLTVEQRADVSTSFLWRHLWQPIHTPHKTFFIPPTNPLGKIFPVIAHPGSAGYEQISVVLMMVPLSGFLIGLDEQHFVFMVLYVKCKLKDLVSNQSFSNSPSHPPPKCQVDL